MNCPYWGVPCLRNNKGIFSRERKDPLGNKVRVIS